VIAADKNSIIDYNDKMKFASFKSAGWRGSRFLYGWLLGAFALLLGLPVAQARFEFPNDLDAQERQASLKIFSQGTAPKFLSNAYPLGGYNGLEVSLSVETFSVEELDTFRPVGQEGTAFVFFPKVTIGKGLFNNSDIFVNFIPFNETTRISKYGLQYRWSFYQARYWPLNLAIMLSGNSANVDNQLITRTLSSDIIASSRFADISVFVSGGYVRSAGSFVGGAQGITSSGQAEQDSVDSLHVSAGITYQPGIMILGISVDQFVDTVTNFKVGFNL